MTSVSILPTNPPEHMPKTVGVISRSGTYGHVSSREEAQEFNTCWYLHRQHRALAEQANITVLFSGVSQWAAKLIEQEPRAAYMERSTRYQDFSKAQPTEFATVDVSRAAREMFSAYNKCVDILADAGVTGPKAFDIARYFLPLGATTSVVCHASPREFSKIRSVLVGEGGAEGKALAEQLDSVMRDEAPSLWDVVTDEYMREEPISDMGIPECVEEYLARPELEGTAHLVASRSQDTYHMDLLISPSTQRALGRYACKSKKCWPILPAELDMLMAAIDGEVDFGAWRDIQRHRKASVSCSPLSRRHGLVAPFAARRVSHDVYARIEGLLLEVAVVLNSLRSPDWVYAAPMAIRRKFQIQASFAQWLYMIDLRTRPEGHVSYRKFFSDCCEVLTHGYPGVFRSAHNHYEEASCR